MKKLLIGLLTLGSISSFASIKSYQINCSKGVVFFQDRADHTLVRRNDVIDVPSYVRGQTNGYKLLESSTHLVSITRYKSQLGISLNKKIDTTQSEIVGSVNYLLFDGNTISLSLKDVDQNFYIIECKIEEK